MCERKQQDQSQRTQLRTGYKHHGSTVVKNIIVWENGQDKKKYSSLKYPGPFFMRFLVSSTDFWPGQGYMVKSIRGLTLS